MRRILINKDNKKHASIYDVDETNSFKKNDKELHSPEVVFKKFYKTLIFFLIKRGASLEDAEDVAQESFLKLFDSMHLYNSNYSIGTFLFNIAKNKLIDKFRANKTERESTSSLGFMYMDEELFYDIKTEDYNPHESLEIKDKKRILLEIIYKLYGKSKISTIIFEKYFLEKTIEEISEERSIPMGTIKSLLYKAKKELKPYLNKSDI